MKRSILNLIISSIIVGGLMGCGQTSSTSETSKEFNVVENKKNLNINSLTEGITIELEKGSYLMLDTITIDGEYNPDTNIVEYTVTNNTAFDIGAVIYNFSTNGKHGFDEQLVCDNLKAFSTSELLGGNYGDNWELFSIQFDLHGTNTDDSYFVSFNIMDGTYEVQKIN